MNCPVLLHHQQQAIDRAKDQPSLLIFRLPGTGKTRIGIEIIKQQLLTSEDSCILWVTPANLIPQLKQNFQDFRIKYSDLFPSRHIDLGKCCICSYDMLRLNCRFVSSLSWDLIICDEIHKAKSNLTDTNHSLWKLRRHAKRWYGFTGTPFQNTPYEFFELVSLCLGHRIGPLCETYLQYRHPRPSPVRNFLRMIGLRLNRLNQGPVIGISNPEKLGNILKAAVDYRSPCQYLQECKLPKVEIQILPVALTKSEEEDYRSVLKRFSRKKKYRTFAADDLDDAQIESCCRALYALRTVALQSSKVVAAVDLSRKILQENHQARILIFCNFVEAGLSILSSALTQSGIDHILYDGMITPSKRETFVKQYLQGEKKLMLLSPVGFEGLDLYGTTDIIIMDPHYNPEHSKQLMSRAIRAFSGVKELRIKKLKSASKNISVPLIDEIIEKIAERKSHVAALLEKVLLDEYNLRE